MTKEVKNITASVKARLLNYAKKEGIAFNRILVYYFQERFLYRVFLSKYKNKLILKGGALLLTLNINKGRSTQDIDFLARLEKLDHPMAEKIVREIAAIQSEDGVIFYPDSVKCSNIREDGTINTLRVHFDATLGSAKGVMQIDISFKDIVIPDPISFQYPTLLDFPAPTLEAYCWETVIAEKFEAMVKLHTLNSRLKDFYDILFLAQRQDFDGKSLRKAIVGTFKKRNIALETTPNVFTPIFMGDETKKVQWQAFLRKTQVTANQDFQKIISLIRDFLEPVATAIAENRDFEKQWDPKKFAWL
ncbi:MAG: nucleotidyl transferase AbiEii/AbiGii toxin family protein [Deltaproteobacteria bacterium]|nr:nucleotidyl transferase AbiEii/AbiGii toxin family protein [Deltaproteobacteria bacterium]